MADIKEAISVERRSSQNGQRMALKDLLAKVVAEYNRLCTVKRHRIDSQRRALIYNLLHVCMFKKYVLTWLWCQRCLSGYPMLYFLGSGFLMKPWTCSTPTTTATSTKCQDTDWWCFLWITVWYPQLPSSLNLAPFPGLPHDVLASDFFVPGSCCRKEAERYKGKDVFGQILTITNETLMLYFDRVLKDSPTKTSNLHHIQMWYSLIGVHSFFQDFCRKASKDAAVKAKAGKPLPCIYWS